MTVDGLRLAVADGIATLTLDRPDKRNAVTYDMWNGITHVCGTLAEDPEVRLLVVRGAGHHFCAGADINGLGATDPGEYQAANEAADHALATFPKPTLAVIRGSCIGGGTEIAVACDLRLADVTARFGITPARLGIVYPATATERLVRRIGSSAAKHLLYSAELVDTDRALRIGLIDELHDADALDARVEALVDLLAHQRSLLTQMASKEIVDAVVNATLDHAKAARWSEEVVTAPDAAEGVSAFLERRQPTFTWTPRPG